MAGLIFGRLVQLAITIMVVVSVVFFLSRLSGDPAALMLPTNARPEQVEALRQQLGLDKPIIEQFWVYIRGVVTEGDFGRSYRLQESALKLVLARLQPTLELTTVALFVALFLGVPAGVISSLKSGTWMDLVIQTLIVIGQSVPTFWLGIVLIIVFSVELGWFPVMGRGGLAALVLPGFTLGAPIAALVGRLLRSSMIEISQSDYVRTARSKGIGESAVVFRHIFRNALVAVVTVTVLQLGTLMGGAVVTETVFSYPGIGLLAVQAIYGRDFALVQAFVAVVAAIIASLNFLADLLYLALDPRIRY